MDVDSLFEGLESTTQLDLKLNFKKFFLDSSLSPKEAALIGLACAESIQARTLIEFFVQASQTAGASSEEIQEGKDAAAIMGLLNAYYRFRHFTQKDAYKRAAGLRMNVMARPVTGKETFEKMALAVSIINGCETCVSSHEQSLVQMGVSEETIHDLARLSSTLNGLAPLFGNKS